MRSRTSVLTIVLFSLSAVAFAADFNGKWTATLPHAALGDINYTYTFQVDGDKVTGTAVTQFFTATLKDVKIDGDQITFIEPVEMAGMAWDFNVKGRLDGDTIKLTRQHKDEPPQDYEAKRAK